MSIERMVLARASGPEKTLDAYLSAAASVGSYHPEEAVKYLSAAMGYTPVTGENPYNEPIEAIKEVADLAGIKLKTPNHTSAVIDRDHSDTSGYLNSLRKSINEHSAAVGDLTEQRQICEEYIAKLDHFTDLDVSIDDLLDCEFLVVRFGCIPKYSYSALDAYENDPYLLFTPCSSDDKVYWGVYCAPRRKIDEVDAVFASLYFEPLKINNASGTVREVIEKIDENIKLIDTELEKLNNSAADMVSENSERINELYAAMMIKKNEFDLRKFAALHNKDFYCVGWIPAKDRDNFREATENLAGVTVQFTDSEAVVKHTPPTKLKNPLLFKPYEYYVEMYGMPDYNGIDITGFVAVTYTLLFGMMFGDLGQGIVLSIAGYLMWKIKKLDLGKILVPCGISSAFFGLVFGSFFGYEHLLDPLYHAIGMKGKPLEVMESINTVLILAIGIGIGLVTTAMILNIISCLKKKKIGEALFSNNGLAGIILYLMLVNLIVAFMNGPKLIPDAVSIPLIAVCAVILFLKEILIAVVDKEKDKMPDNATDFILQNVFEMLEYLLSYFSNTVSFLRVGAFVLVHAGMMMVVFSLAGENANIFVVILGNALVIVLEGLLTGIQALRLEFYEMFSRCFEGNGRPFISINKIRGEK